MPAAPASADRILATGDSMMYVMQDELAQALRERGHEVTVDGRFGTGLTKPWILDWTKHAHAQVRGSRPDVTFMFLGGNDLFPIAGASCCGRAWVQGYVRRVRRLVRIYGRTIWMTLPTPRDRGLAKGFRRVNLAVRRAVRREPRAQLLDLVPAITPGRRYRRRMRRDGERVFLRQMDGVHLWGAGVQIAVEMAVDALHTGA
ncbi:MAG TPA: GDSL-type esterase/lipase family protein [Solirubrobacteraceae bacterium]|nr:GDSL-type esterase/lipase family protein [Solirubrobacteraceae bacterium]